MVSYEWVALGRAFLVLGLICGMAAMVFLLAGKLMRRESATKVGYYVSCASAVALLVSCLTIMVGFFTHNVAFQYVAQNYPADTTGPLAWLFLLAGLWAGRAGSLLFWGFLISLFGAWVAWSRRRHLDDLTTIALVVIELVSVLFMLTMLMSSSNNPFLETSRSLIDADGNLTGSAMLWGMNVLLEHWAMALHPPTLFIGYAGMTVPFAYAIAALVMNDPSRRWIDLCQRVALFAFIFLTIGIGLGAVWAYVVLGWGGYWGWDPVENASLLSWLTSVAMLHSFNAYRKRAMMRGWALLSATLTFTFVIMGTFITRSGIVESVHAFSEDPVSTTMFLVMMIGAMGALLAGWFWRRKSFMSEDDIESIVSKNGSYYLTDLIMVFSGILLAYLTISSALPTFLPAGGVSIGAGAYETIARPLGILFCLLAAVCPFLSWRKTDGAEFWRNIRIPLVAALVIFAGLLVLFFTRLLPAYDANIAEGGTVAANLAEMGPAPYYHGLAIFGLLVASLLACNSFYLLVRGVRARMQNKEESLGQALVRLFSKTPAQAGGYLTHLGLGIVLVGLIGSSMYVTERTCYFDEGEQATVQLGSYEVTYLDTVSEYNDANDMIYTSSLEVSRSGRELGIANPSVMWIASTNYGQTRLQAAVYSSLGEDLFIALQGFDYDGAAVMNIRVNPLIWVVWIGFFVMVAGIIAATIPRRGASLAAHVEASSATSGPAGSPGASRALAAEKSDAAKKGSRSKKSR